MNAVTVRLPLLLSQLIGGSRDIDVRGGTIREALDDLVSRQPSLSFHLFDESGALRGNVLCHCRELCSRTRGGLDRPTEPGDTITILNSVAGG
jgi:molybdopterin converting factor small subunit